MRPNNKTTKDPEREKVIHKKKRVPKPWILEIKVVDEEIVKRNSFLYKSKELGKWYPSTWDKFISIDQALRELSKQARSNEVNGVPYYQHWKFAGREFRLVNKETEEVVDLIIKEKQVCQKEE